MNSLHLISVFELNDTPSHTANCYDNCQNPLLTPNNKVVTRLQDFLGIT